MKTSLHPFMRSGNAISTDFFHNSLAYRAAVRLDDPALAPWWKELPHGIARSVSRVRALWIATRIELALACDGELALPAGHAHVGVHEWAAPWIIGLSHDP